MSRRKADERVVAGRYRLETKLGAGGMGEVWRARDERLARTVAVKLIKGGDGPDAPARLARFEREAKVTAMLSGHPHIVTVYDFGQDPIFVVMEMLLIVGEPPFGAGPIYSVLEGHVSGEVVAPRVRRPEISVGLDRLVLALLAKRPGERPADAATVRDWLDDLIAGKRGGPAPAPRLARRCARRTDARGRSGRPGGGRRRVHADPARPGAHARRGPSPGAGRATPAGGLDRGRWRAGAGP